MIGEVPDVAVGQVLLGRGYGVPNVQVTAIHDNYVVARAMTPSAVDPSGFILAWRNRIPLHTIGTDYLPSC